MSWSAAFLVALLAGTSGMLLAGVVAGGYVDWYSVSYRDGAAGYLIVFVALLGGLGGFVFALVVARIAPFGPEAGFARTLAAAVVPLLFLAALAAIAGYLSAQ